MDKRIDSNLESQLIIDNLGLIVAQARKFKPTPITDIDDYKQAGALALLRAIRRYDPSRASLATFSWKSIYREMLREAEKYKPTFSIVEEVPQTEHELFLEMVPDLTPEQFQILWLRLSGYSLEEIGQQFEETKQSINNKLSIITSIIRNANEENKVVVGQ